MFKINKIKLLEEINLWFFKFIWIFIRLKIKNIFKTPKQMEKSKPKPDKTKIRQKLRNLVNYLFKTNMLHTKKIGDVMAKVDRGDFTP